MARRRGHGEGTIFKRKLGGKFVGWMAMVEMGWEDGKRKRKAVYGPTEAAVQAKLKEVRRSLDAGLDISQASQTLGEWLTKWLSQLESGQKRRSNTLRRYSSLVR